MMKQDFIFIGYDGRVDQIGSGPPSPVPMSHLAEGACGRIVRVDLDQLDLQRLEVMGLCAGRLVQIVKRSDPMIVRVLGTRIGLAAGLANSVYVVPNEVK